MPKFKVRMADEEYRYGSGDVREVEVANYVHSPEAEAAARYAEERCSDRGEYEEDDVQVLMPEGWVTFSIHIVSVPEFSASRNKRVFPIPELPTCEDCGEEFAGTKADTVCNDCQSKRTADELEESE